MPIRQVFQSRVPIKVWTDDIEAEAIGQLQQSGALPFVYKHIAVMPDVHAGRGSTIGSVIATVGAIVPATAGVDLGCGMTAVKTSIRPDQMEGKLSDLRSQIERSVPTGMNGHKDDRALKYLDTSESKALISGGNEINARVNLDLTDRRATLKRGVAKFPYQLGTLGGGNHFIEVCVSKKNEVWLVLHSGSRGVGNLIAQHHINTAKGLMAKMFVSVPHEDLSYLVEKTPEYDNYMHDMMWAQEFARLNRKVMRILVLNQMKRMFPEMETSDIIDCHHNYIAREHHYGKNVLVTRKGAIRAQVGDLGIIPGSMGAKSFIVRGLGNAESFNSASHGAGRKMSRTKARAMFSTEDLAKQTEGVECRKDSAVVDEIPACYKSIEEVMGNQADLVEPIEELKQVLCVKGA